MPTIFAAADPTPLQNLPMIAHTVVAASLVAGVILWLAGGKVLRPAFCTLGALIGGGVGFLAAPSFTESVAGYPSPYVGLGVGAVGGLVAGMTLFRFAVALSTGLAFLIAGLLVSATYLNLTVGLQSPPPPVAPAPSELIESAPPASLTVSEKARRVMVEGVKPVADRVQAFVTVNAQGLREQWDAQSEQHKVVLGVSSLGAGLFGFFLSLFAPRRSTAIATAIVGSAVVIGSCVWLMLAFNAPGARSLDQGPIVWLVVWAVAAVLGLIVQVRSGRGRRAEPAGVPA